MAKAYEAASLPAHSVEMEQFIHCEIFTVREGTNVVIICPAGRTTSRAVELARGLSALNAVTIAITDDAELAEAATHAVRLPDGCMKTTYRSWPSSRCSGWLCGSQGLGTRTRTSSPTNGSTALSLTTPNNKDPRCMPSMR